MHVLIGLLKFLTPLSATRSPWRLGWVNIDQWQRAINVSSQVHVRWITGLIPLPQNKVAVWAACQLPWKRVSLLAVAGCAFFTRVRSTNQLSKSTTSSGLSVKYNPTPASVLEHQSPPASHALWWSRKSGRWWRHAHFQTWCPSLPRCPPSDF